MGHKILGEGRLKVAIIGGGPAGLGAAIEFTKLQFADWTLYEQAPAIHEIGAGISLPRNTWRLLDLLGASKNLDPKDFYRSSDGHYTQHRNGRTGELLVSHGQGDTPSNHLHARLHRAVLQNALLKEVRQENIRLSQKLIRVTQKPSGRLFLEFQGGLTDEVDLLVGADGVRSVVRTFVAPDHKISYTGKTSYRTVVSNEDINMIPGVPDAVTFWQGPNAWLYTCPLGNGKFEITCLTHERSEGGEKEKVSWGQDAKIEDLTRHFVDFAPIVRKIVALPKDLKQYALFSGPRLDSVVGKDVVALVGDASHPLSGAFGAGAGFALEDIYVLTQAISWAHDCHLELAKALELFDQVRSPHYAKLYGILDEFARTQEFLGWAHLSFDTTVQVLLEKTWGQQHHWLYDYDIQKVFQHSAKAEKSRKSEPDGGTIPSML